MIEEKMTFSAIEQDRACKNYVDYWAEYYPTCYYWSDWFALATEVLAILYILRGNRNGESTFKEFVTRLLLPNEGDSLTFLSHVEKNIENAKNPHYDIKPALPSLDKLGTAIWEKDSFIRLGSMKAEMSEADVKVVQRFISTAASKVNV